MANEKKYRISIDADGSKALREVEKVRKELAKAGTPDPSDQQVVETMRQNQVKRTEQKMAREADAARAKDMDRHARRLADAQMFGEKEARLREKLRDRAEKSGKTGKGESAFGLPIGVAAVDYAGQQLAKYSAIGKDLSTQYRNGDLSQTDMAIRAGESIPVIGGYVSAGRNIREMITGEQYGIDRTNAMSQRQDQQANRHFDFYQQHRLEKMDIESATAASGERMGILRARGAQRDKIAIEAEAKRAARTSQLMQERSRVEEDRDYRDASRPLTDRRSELKSKSAAHGGQLTKVDAEELSQLNAQIQSMQKDHQTALTTIMERGEEQRKQIANETAEKEKQRVIELGKFQESEAVRHGAKMLAAEGSRLEMNGGQFEGRQKQAQAQYQDEEQAIKEYYREQIASRPAEQKKLEEMRDKEIASAQSDRDAKLQQSGREERLTVAANQRELLANQATFQANQLKLSGQGFAAQLVLTKDAYQRRLQEIEQWEQEELRKNPQRAAQIKAQAEAKRGLAGQEQQEGGRQAAESEYSRRQGVQGTLAGQMEATLAQQSRMGVSGAAMAGERLKIKQEYAQRREELEKLMRDPTASAQEKQLAQGVLGGLGAEEKKAEKMAGYRGPSSGLSDAQDSGYGSGNAIAANERSQNGIDRVAAASEQTNKLLADLLALMAANNQPLSYAGI